MAAKLQSYFEERRATVCALLLLVMLWVVAFHPWLSGGVIVPYDAFDFAYPTMLFAARSLHHGAWPWWNPYVYSGYPQIADPQALTFSPSSTGLMALFDQPTPLLFDRILIAHLALAGVGMFLLSRAMGRSLSAAIIAGLIAMIGGCVTARLQHAQLLIAYGFLPWVGFGAVRFLTNPSIGRSVLFGVFLGVLGVHLLQDTYIALVLLAETILVCLVYRLATDRNGMGRFAIGLVVAATVTLLICGWQVVAMLSFLPETQRAALAIEASRDDSAPWRLFMTLLRPEYWHGDWGDYSGTISKSEGTIYGGILAVPLVLIGLGHLVRRACWGSTRLMKLSAVLLLTQAAFLVLYGLGLTTPVYHLYYDVIPGVRLFRRPVDAFYVLNLYIALFSAVGFDALSPMLSRRASYLFLCVAAALLLISVIGPSPYVWSAFNATHFCLALAVAGLVLGFALVPRQRQVAPFCVALCLAWVADLRTHTLAGSSLNAGNPRFADIFPDHSRLAETLRAALTIPGQPSARIEQNIVNYYWSNAPSAFKISATQGYNPFVYSRYDQVFGTSQGRQSERPFTPWARSYDSPVFNLMGARYVISFPFTDVSKTLKSLGFTADIYGDGMVAWHNPRALPRVLTPTDVAFWSGDSSRDHSLAATVDFRRTLMLSPTDRSLVAGACSGSVSTFELLAEGNDESRYAVSAGSGGGWFVVTDQATDGWHSAIDGKPTPLYRGDLLVRAVCVPPGSHVVTFRFEPFRKMADWVWHNVTAIAGGGRLPKDDGTL
ncbi:hypothetical protein [Acidisoma sp. 7E03]